MLTLQYSRSVLIGVLLALAVSCSLFGKKYAADPGLLVDGFGTGIQLLMQTSDVPSVTYEQSEWLEVWVVAREELSQRSPYAERPENKDLVVAVYSKFPEDPAAAIPGAEYETIEELRCYLAISDSSQLTLLGEKLVDLAPRDVERLLGACQERTESGDGRVYLTYLFKVAGSKRILKLVSSHEAYGDCFAISLALVTNTIR